MAVVAQPIPTVDANPVPRPMPDHRVVVTELDGDGRRYCPVCWELVDAAAMADPRLGDPHIAWEDEYLPEAAA